VRDARFEDEGGGPTVVRVYSGVAPSGVEALTVALGMQGDVNACGIQLNEGWRWDTMIGQMTAHDGRMVQAWRTACAPGTRVASANRRREWPR
jgi:hypothetical protein